MNVPDLYVPGQNLTAFLCVVNAQQRGVFQIEDAKRVYVDRTNSALLAIDRADGSTDFWNLSTVWGAWLDWPYKEYRRSSGNQRMGPEYFLEMVWNEWEWIEQGISMRRYSPVPNESSIWCDRAQTEPEIMTTEANLGYSSWYFTGWARKGRVARHNLVESFHFPSMP